MLRKMGGEPGPVTITLMARCDEPSELVAVGE